MSLPSLSVLCHRCGLKIFSLLELTFMKESCLELLSLLSQHESVVDNCTLLTDMHRHVAVRGINKDVLMWWNQQYAFADHLHLRLMDESLIPDINTPDSPVSISCLEAIEVVLSETLKTVWEGICAVTRGIIKLVGKIADYIADSLINIKDRIQKLRSIYQHMKEDWTHHKDIAVYEYSRLEKAYRLLGGGISKISFTQILHLRRYRKLAN